MADFILITGDKAMFNPTFGQAIVTDHPGDLVGTGKDKINQKLVCVDGDEKKVIVPGCPYMTSQYSIPGVGILSMNPLLATKKPKRQNLVVNQYCSKVLRLKPNLKSWFPLNNLLYLSPIPMLLPNIPVLAHLFL